MIHTDSIAFIHFMKTGGMSMTRYLINVADGPVHAFSDRTSHAHTRKMPLSADSAARLTCVDGPRHADMATALRLIRDNGLILPPRAVVMIRHPVDLMLSFYKHLQKPHVWTQRGMTRDTLRGQVKVAVQNSFADFARQVRFYGLDDAGAAAYFQQPGPEAGFETRDIVPLAQIDAYLAVRFGQCRNYPHVRLGHQNRSRGGQHPDAVDADTRAYICRSYPQLRDIYEMACATRW